jgi:hypothetical protein
VAEQIKRRIEQDCEASAFIDVLDLQKGDDIEDRVFDAMRSIDELVVLLTPWALDRNWLWVEIGAARALERRIVPVFYQVTLDALDAKGGPTFLRSRNVVDVNELEIYFVQLRTRVKDRERS